MSLDPTTSIGKVRLRVGDYFDFPIFPDAVYQTTLDDNDSNVVRAARLMAQYILGALSMRVHEVMMQLEVYGNQYIDNYVNFLKTTILNPNFMEVAPIPYAGASIDTTHPLLEFQKNWNAMYYSGTEDEQTALQVPGDRLGFF